MATKNDVENPAGVINKADDGTKSRKDRPTGSMHVGDVGKSVLNSVKMKSSLRISAESHHDLVCCLGLLQTLTPTTLLTCKKRPGTKSTALVAVTLLKNGE